MSKKELDLVVIKIVQGELTAQVMKSHLQCEGIPVLLQSESLGKVYGLIADGIGEVKILVPREVADKAKEMLEDNAAR